MRWMAAPAIAALLCGAASALTSAPAFAGPEPVLDRALTPAEVAEWRIGRAVSQYGRGDFAAAARTLAPVIDGVGASDDVRALALFNRGAARLQMSRFADAIDDFDAAEALSFAVPAKLHLARGIAWEHLSRPERAAEDYVDALRADPDDPSVRAKIREFFHKP